VPTEPQDKRAIAFVDGQNLFYAAKIAFGYSFPNYDPPALAGAICTARNWRLTETRFYTGVPSPEEDSRKHGFWTKKLAGMRMRGVVTYSRPLRYRNRVIPLPDGGARSFLVGQEKGIDVRIALDIVRLALGGQLDVALVFSQDQDLSEVADEVKQISIMQSRWIKVACAFPVSPTTTNKRGINGTDWIRIDRAMYDAALDRTDYRA
jgi:uncharacterized LabA/DUF88 family protein